MTNEIKKFEEAAEKATEMIRKELVKDLTKMPLSELAEVHTALSALEAMKDLMIAQARTIEELKGNLEELLSKIEKS